MICKACGAENSTVAVFCDQCGFPFVGEEEAAKIIEAAIARAATADRVPAEPAPCQHEADKKSGCDFCPSCGQKL